MPKVESAAHFEYNVLKKQPTYKMVTSSLNLTVAFGGSQLPLGSTEVTAKTVSPGMTSAILAVNKVKHGVLTVTLSHTMTEKTLSHSSQNVAHCLHFFTQASPQLTNGNDAT